MRVVHISMRYDHFKVATNHDLLPSLWSTESGLNSAKFLEKELTISFLLLSVAFTLLDCFKPQESICDRCYRSNSR
uniref:Uncharacterized protein n=1 Tax=Salix viminalis TaxID=40686 RepID=A0A6N2KEG5_SALVM